MNVAKVCNITTNIERLVEKKMKGKLKLKFGTPHDFIMSLF